MRRVERFIIMVAAWVFISLILLETFDAVDLKLFFILLLLGFLVLTEVIAAPLADQTWKRRINFLIAIGFIIFIYIVVEKVREVLR